MAYKKIADTHSPIMTKSQMFLLLQALS